MLNYVLITAARNEEKHLERVIFSVTTQTVLPLAWIIVSDASTDSTDNIVSAYAERIPWIKLLRMPKSQEQGFSRKALAFNMGWSFIRHTNFDLAVNLDADVSFNPDYMEYMLVQFEENPRLGVAGTRFREGNYISLGHIGADFKHVCGQVQVFRKSCLEELDGYIEMPYGGLDVVAVTRARMLGWKTRTFSDKLFEHHRKMGSLWSTELRARLIEGRKDYVLGNHPLWQMLRILNRMRKKPYCIGGVYVLLGYLFAYSKQLYRPQGQDFVDFRRMEQLRRIGNAFRIKWICENLTPRNVYEGD